MGENAALRNGSVWRWVAALLASILLAGSPGMIYALRAPSQTQVDVIRERQQIILQRLAGIDVEIEQLNAELAALRLDLQRHQDQREGGSR